MPRIFISYRRADPDQRVAAFLHTYLKARGLGVFRDVDMTVGVRWEREIEEQLDSADFFVILISKQSKESDMVREEVNRVYALNKKRGKPVILPVRLAYTDALPYGMGSWLNPLQCALWQGHHDSQKIADELAQAIDGPNALPIAVPLASPFQTAGMLPVDHPSYVPRECDREFAGLLADPKVGLVAICGDYQIGKSSLMIRAARILGDDWNIFRPSLGDLRSDKVTMVVDDFFESFRDAFGEIKSWPQFRQYVSQKPTLLMLDDLANLESPGARVLLPRLIDAVAEARGKFRIVATLPKRIDELLTERDVANDRYHRPWKSIWVKPFQDDQARRLLALLPEPPCRATASHFDEILRRSKRKPRLLQCLADQLWKAYECGAAEPQFVEIIQAQASYDW
jgi:hypothetical protein